jgi:4-diphosphocytidyl-2-C-methyl-D-erythritol kinase
VTPVVARAPAKINLQLSVGPLRRDGYHDVVNVLHAVSLYDDVTVAPADRLTVDVVGESSGAVPRGADNLAARAAIALAERVGVEPRVRLNIRKRIPMAGGMAGGSADAAAALVACDALWGTGMRREALQELAATIGADVPFALLGGTAVGLGRGDRMMPVLARGEFHWVFAVAAGGLSTPAVYGECDRLRRGRKLAAPTVDATLMAALRVGDPVALGRSLSNDLEPAVLSLRPQLQLTLEAGLEHGALGAVVCGSGPTCGFLVRSADAAIDLAVRLSATGLCRDVKRASGPVPGARVLPRAAST